MKFLTFLILFALAGTGFAYGATFATGFVMGHFGATHEDARNVGMIVQGVAILLAAVGAYSIAYEKPTQS